MFEPTLPEYGARESDAWSAPEPDAEPGLQDVDETMAQLWAAERGLVEPGAATQAVADAVDNMRGADLGRFLLSLPDRTAVDGWTVVEAMKGWEKVIRFAQGQQLAWVAELGSRRPAAGSKWSRGMAAERDLSGVALPDPGVAEIGDDARACAAEVALALDLPRMTAHSLLVDACRLDRVLPETLRAVQVGDLSLRSARVIADQTSVLPDEQARTVQGSVLDWLYGKGAGKTTARVTHRVRRAVLRVDPAGARLREQHAVAHRYVRPYKDVEDGMVRWEAALPAAESVAAWERLVSMAEAARHDGDTRTVDARRADVLVDLILGRPVSSVDARPGDSCASRLWRTDVVVGAPTLLGLDEGPGELVGWGPITSHTARRLAGLDGRLSAVWRRMLTDPQSGVVRDYGTKRYRPNRSLVDLVKAREGRCMAPGCRTPSSGADIDHIRNSPAGPSPRPDAGGATADWNLGAVCRTDHRIKSMAGWKVESPEAGAFVWTTPTGHTYRRDPEPPLGHPQAVPRSHRDEGSEPDPPF